MTKSPFAALPDVITFTTFKKTKIYQLCADPVSDFPRPVKLGKSSRWSWAELNAWAEKQLGVNQKIGSRGKEAHHG